MDGEVGRGRGVRGTVFLVKRGRRGGSRFLRRWKFRCFDTRHSAVPFQSVWTHMGKVCWMRLSSSLACLCACVQLCFGKEACTLEGGLRGSQRPLALPANLRN